MVEQKMVAAKSAFYDLVGIVMRIVRERDAGLDINDREAVARLAQKVELDLAPRINPDRRYRIAELKAFGYKPGFFYGRNRHLIRKDHRSTFILGRDLLAVTESAPSLAPTSALPAEAVAAPRRRGRPRKAAASKADRALAVESGVVNTC